MMIGFSGRYRLEKRRHGIVIEQTPWFDNLITDAGLNSFGTGFSVPRVYLGTGSSAPGVGDTGLSGSLLAERTLVPVGASQQTETEPYYHVYTYQTSFLVGAVVGTVSEIAIGRGLPIDLLFSKSLVYDINGVLTSVTYTDLDQAVVHYELRQYPVIEDLETEITINEVVRAVVVRPANLGVSGLWVCPVGQIIRSYVAPTTFLPARAYTGALGSIFGVPEGTTADGVRNTELPYAAGSLKRETSCFWDPITMAGTFPSFRTGYYGGGQYQFSIDPPIIKTDRQTLRLDYECRWGRYEEE
jgi:hypothetical protein